MSEKQFELLLPNAVINDTIVRKSYYLSEKEDVEKIVGLLNEQQSTITALKEENEELRKTIKEVQGLLTEEVDLFSDKATEHDIVAYKELNEFDNKDAYYMCISTKKAIKMLQRWLE